MFTFGQNQTLFDQAIKQGLTWVTKPIANFFANPDGSYYGFPVGYITNGVHTNGNPYPYQFNVCLGGSWWMQNFKRYEDGLAAALAKQEQVLKEIENGRQATTG